MTDIETKECPQCRSTIPVNKGFVTWCDTCDWNISPSLKNSPSTIIDEFHKKISNKYSSSLFNSVINNNDFKPKADGAQITGFILSGFVHWLALCFFISALFLIIYFWPNVFAIILGLLFLGITWFIRPRVNSLPNDIISRDQFPQTYSLVDNICDHLGSRPIDGIVITDEFNASMGSYGFKRKRILTIGLPLWNLLSNEEKLALLGHEIAHTVNHDPQRRFLVHSAISTLTTLHYLLYPEYLWPPGTGPLGIGAIPFTLLSLGFSKLFYFGALVLSQVMWQSSQRAEYYADYLATKVSGVTGALQLLNKLHYSHIVDYAIHKAALNPDYSPNIFTIAKDVAEHVPKREIERLLRIDKIQLNHITTHPPTYYRIEFLNQHSFKEGLFNAAPSLFDQIEEELQPLYNKFNKTIQFEYRDGLYHR